MECGQPVPATAEPPAAPVSPTSYTPRHLAEKILAGRDALAGERKQVTVLFADVVGSTELIRDRDPEDAQRLLDGAVQDMMRAIHEYEGTVSRLMGDGLMAMFGAPVAHEDHAVRACHAALAMLAAARGYAEAVRRSHGATLQVRVGINSGEVVVRLISDDLHMDYTAMGQTVHLASRMEGLASGGTGLLTPDTLALVEGLIEVRPLGPTPVKGLEQPIDVYELVGVGTARTRLEVSAARGLTRFVGRQRELDQIQAALRQAGPGHGQVVALVGEAGVGKSRLVHEATEAAQATGWQVLQCGAVSYGTATPYLPVIELLRRYGRIEPGEDLDRTVERLTSKVLALDPALKTIVSPLLALLDLPIEDTSWASLDPPRRRRATLDALERLLLRESQERPLLLVFEDLHWIDAETQALLDRLVESIPGARILLLVNYRPEYGHRWGNQRTYTQLRIEPLASEGSEALLRSLLGANEALDSLNRHLIEHTGGNPFFLEECVRSLVETGALVGRRGAFRLTQELPDIRVPATVQAILAARIDRLEPHGKRALQMAAVIGKDVPFALLRAISELSEDALDAVLARLQAAELLYAVSLPPEREYTFTHALTHEVAYGSLLQERRRELHGQIVGAIEQLYSERLAEHVERLAYHATRAESWEKATTYGQQAGRRAVARSAFPEAVGHFEQAVAVADRLSPTREHREQAIDLRLELRAALRGYGDDDRAIQHLWDAEALAEEIGDRRRLAWTDAHLAATLWMAGRYEQAIGIARRSATLIGDDGDVRVHNQAYQSIGLPLWGLGRYREAAEYFRRSLSILPEEQRATRSAQQSATPGVMAVVNLAWTLAELGDFEEARACEQEAIRLGELSPSPLERIQCYMRLGSVAVRQGDAERVIGQLEYVVEVCRAQEQRFSLPIGVGKLGAAYLTVGYIGEALPLLEEAVEHARTSNYRAEGSQWLVWLAEAHLRDGRSDDAQRVAEEALAGTLERNERGNEAWTRRLLGEISAQGEPPDAEEAERQYQAALSLAETLEMRPLQAHCHLGLGKLYRRLGRHTDARTELSTAITLLRNMQMTRWLPEAEEELARIDTAGSTDWTG